MELGVNFSNESVVESNSRLHDSVMEAIKIIKENIYWLINLVERQQF